MDLIANLHVDRADLARVFALLGRELPPHEGRKLGTLVIHVSKALETLVKVSRQDDAGRLSSTRVGESHDLTVVQELSGADSEWIVVFDSPPLLVTSEARVLAKSVGQIVMIVCAGKTSHDAVIDAASNLDTSKPVSVILNQGVEKSGADFYGYGARSYGSGIDTS